MREKHEVEYRALIASGTFNELLSKGREKYGHGFRGPLSIEDAYFCPQEVKSFEEIEMDTVGSYSLRLRRETENGKDTATLNTKTIEKVGDHNAWLEHEVGVSSYEESRKILEAIGFKIFFELKKSRYSYVDGDIQVCLEDIENFQPIIEVAILTSQDGIEDAKNKLPEYLAQNHIDPESIVKKSVTNMLMRDKSFF